MLPIFNEYRKMLKDFGIDLSDYDKDKLWIDRLIIRGFDKQGNDRKICRLKVNDNLKYEYKFYSKIPTNDELETWEESYQRLSTQIAEKERDSINVIKNFISNYPEHEIILTTSMGKDSKLTDYLLNKATNKNYRKIFNNTTLDCADVYKEVKQYKDIEIVNPNSEPFYRLMRQWGTPSRFARWCCSIFKEGSTVDYLSDVDKVLFMYGMRNEESSTRSNYGDEVVNPQWTNPNWIGCLPIRKWTELELWLYTIHNNIHINSKYKKGYSRVGCAIACPYYTKSTWILDKYWYKSQYDRFHKIIENDFITNEKWCRMNCTLDEYHLNWNGGQIRKNPTDKVIDEFMQYKGFNNRELAKQYFQKKCMICDKNVYKKNEIAMNLKLFGRGINKFMCKKCMMKEFGWTDDDWNKQVQRFKQQGCTLF